MPRENKWHATRGKMDLEGKREELDKLKATYVIWCPCGDHRAHSPSQPFFLYSGFISHDKFIHPHLLERVLRQLGSVQGEPTLSPAMRPTCESVNKMFAEYQNHLVRPTQCDFQTQTSDGYMVWFNSVSHTRVVPRESIGQTQDIGVRTTIMMCLTFMCF